MFRSAQNVKSAFGIKFLKISEKNSILKNGTFYQRYRWWYLLYGPDKTGISLDETRRSKIEISWQNCSFFKKFKKKTKKYSPIYGNCEAFWISSLFLKTKTTHFQIFHVIFVMKFSIYSGLIIFIFVGFRLFFEKMENFHILKKNGRGCDSRQ